MIDVRDPAEFETSHIAGSSNVPLNLLGEHAARLAARLDRQVVPVCESGARAGQAQQRLAGVGADHVHVLDGGIGVYATAGGEVVHGRAPWALERQVRLLAGSLVVLGTTLGWRLRRPALLAGGVGAGLTVSALTHTALQPRPARPQRCRATQRAARRVRRLNRRGRRPRTAVGAPGLWPPNSVATYSPGRKLRRGS